MWTHTLVPRVAIARARAPAGPAANKRGAHEAALRKWLEALEAANAQLRGLGREGHINMLRQQVGGGAAFDRGVDRAALTALRSAFARAGKLTAVNSAIPRGATKPWQQTPTQTPPPPNKTQNKPQVLLELLKRVDALLFHYLVHPEPSEAAPRDAAGTDDSGSGLGAVLMDARNPNMPVLDESMLFFTRGALTFGTGMQVGGRGGGARAGLFVAWGSLAKHPGGLRAEPDAGPAHCF